MGIQQFRMKHINTIKFTFFILLLSTSFFIGCTQSNNDNPKLILQKTYLVDDKSGKIYRKPNFISIGNDKYMDFVIYPDYILRYDFETGKLITILDSIHFNIDSLIEKTYQVYNKKTFLYLPHNKSSLSNANKNLYQVAPFSTDGNYYYIPVGIKSQAKFVYNNEPNDKTRNTSEDKNAKDYLKKMEEKHIDSIQKFYASSNVVSEETNNFIIVTDKNFKQLNIFPLEIDFNDYFISKQKCGYYFQNNFYFSSFARNITMASDELSLQGYEPSFYFTAISLSKDGIRNKRPIINKRLINSDIYSVSQGLSRKVSYAVTEDKLIASMGKEFINLSDNKLYSHQPILDNKEYISHLSINNKFIIYTTEKYVRKKQISKEAAAFGAADSIAECYIKVQNLENDKLVLKSNLKLQGMYSLSASGELYEYLEKSDSILINKFKIKL